MADSDDNLVDTIFHFIGANNLSPQETLDSLLLAISSIAATCGMSLEEFRHGVNECITTNWKGITVATTRARAEN